ncbi:hypothetical protein HS125_10640 [bacterium]|nr:hypothetical protein [bacterium]
MNTLRWLIHLVLVAYFIVLAIVMFTLGTSHRVSHAAHEWVWRQAATEGTPWHPERRLAYGAGAILLILGALTAATLPRRDRRGDVLTYSQEGTEVRIARRAVEDFVSKLGKEIDGVSDMSCWIAAKNDWIQVNVHVSVDVGRVAIPSACQAVKATLEREMRETLGFPNVGEVTVQVSRLAQTGPRARARKGEETLPAGEESYSYTPPPET